MCDMFLGFDVSTQSCKACVISDCCEVLFTAKVVYDDDLPHYKTTNGVILGYGGVDGKVTSPPIMWIEAMELCLHRLKTENSQLDFGRIRSISGSGQQHGTIFWNAGAEKLLTTILCDSKSSTDRQGLAQKLASAMHPMAPVWMDTSTRVECDALETTVGGPLELARMTGSRAYTRFSVHLITQHLRADRVASNGTSDIKKTHAVSLVSSFGASLMCGRVVAIDVSDAAGMNVMDISTKQWHPAILAYMQQRIRATSVNAVRAFFHNMEPQPSWQVAGTVAPWWQERFGLAPSCIVGHWSGDNPCSVVAMGVMAQGDVAISLGTSDTCLCVLPVPPSAPLPFGHLFPHPTLNDKYFAMLCYTNGDVTRRHVRDTYAASSWNTFSAHLNTTPPGNNNLVGIYATTPEITPPYQLSAPHVLHPQGSIVSDAMHCRAVIEHRALAIKCHLQQLDPEWRPTRVTLTGGASVSPAIRQVFSDVFNAPVRTLDIADSAALGAAMRALHTAKRENQGFALPRVGAHEEVMPRSGVDYSVLERLYVEAEARVLAGDTV
eukprot:GEMP01028607.1.p1 GENE.GEMP01028607.1~~GEMP01028607.1.p1  ORF type:complete len:565 (+),score=103.29 GEMP01028607.1:47-1696(+)